ncbi:tetratricopeptide repeat protein [Priestia megaterium]|uniref:Uncharacterized protein n=1 Tax=Priestia megaterium (strain DSM 319 / IMG 1521) TaxID=592022 RepID=D5DLM7_PRIM3|nr:tetratricopeptide repeat protein [Priestia megaterium]ADF41503.1 conserved hypothetical protein [Priestia megaterium DSM 319]MED4219097.1 tetratricopeptide repeat protein [Priestia megaterium]WEZ40554.1 tetratricopeptide repeat protein [Priestia megaterium DSM 319]
MSNEQQNKIVAFPLLKERLVEKATDHMQHKQFQEALPLFEQAYELDNKHHEILLGLVICHVELGDAGIAKELCEQMLKEDIGDYYHNLQMYLMVLIQLGHYHEGYVTLQAVIQEHKLPAEHAEQLYQLLEFCKNRMNQEQVIEEQTEEEQLEQFKSFTAVDNIQDQIEWVHSLKTKRIEKQRVFLEQLFSSEAVHPIVKTVALKTVMEEEVDIDFMITKFGETKKVNALQLQRTTPYLFAEQVEAQLTEKLEHENPTLLQVAVEIWQRHLFITFPFLPGDNVKLWTAAVYAVSLMMQGEESDAAVAEVDGSFSAVELRKAIKELKEIEEISFI